MTDRTTAPVIFAIAGSEDLGQRIARHLGTSLSPHEERAFEDGEQKIRSLVDVRGAEVHVVCALNGDGRQSANDRLCRILFFVAALKDAAAARITAVVPYLCYARKDRRTKFGDPVTSRYVAQLFEAVGTARVVTMEAHNLPALENAFRCGTDHLSANAAFLSHLLPLVGDAPVAVVSPDPGGVKRADILRREMETALERPVAAGFMEKHRSMGVVSGDLFAGDVAGRVVIVLDDLISSGGTMARTAAACRERGAVRVYLAATHGLFSEGAIDVLSAAPADRIIVTNTVQPPATVAKALAERLHILDVSDIFADAIGGRGS